MQTVNRILTSLLYVSRKRGLLYVTDTFLSSINPRPTHKFEHLSCFLPGVLALGAHTLPDSAFKQRKSFEDRPTLIEEVELSRHNWRELHMLAAEGLAQTCYRMYADQPSGLGPNEVLFNDAADKKDLWIRRIGEWRRSGKWGLAPGIGARRAASDNWQDKDYKLQAPEYSLRPEVWRLRCSELCSDDYSRRRY